jgi:hypothetical protein
LRRANGAVHEFLPKYIGATPANATEMPQFPHMPYGLAAGAMKREDVKRDKALPSDHVSRLRVSGRFVRPPPKHYNLNPTGNEATSP